MRARVQFTCVSIVIERSFFEVSQLQFLVRSFKEFQLKSQFSSVSFSAGGVPGVGEGGGWGWGGMG